MKGGIKAKDAIEIKDSKSLFSNVKVNNAIEILKSRK